MISRCVFMCVCACVCVCLKRYNVEMFVNFNSAAGQVYGNNWSQDIDISAIWRALVRFVLWLAKIEHCGAVHAIGGPLHQWIRLLGLSLIGKKACRNRNWYSCVRYCLSKVVEWTSVASPSQKDALNHVCGPWCLRATHFNSWLSWEKNVYLIYNFISAVYCSILMSSVS